VQKRRDRASQEAGRAGVDVAVDGAAGLGAPAGRGAWLREGEGERERGEGGWVVVVAVPMRCVRVVVVVPMRCVWEGA
jgi:hypothetical protein